MIRSLGLKKGRLKFRRPLFNFAGNPQMLTALTKIRLLGFLIILWAFSPNFSSNQKVV